MREGGIKESKLTQIKKTNIENLRNVSLRKRIEVLERSLYELREKVHSLESEIRKMREYIGMSE